MPWIFRKVNSPIHNLDPRVKFIYVIAIFIASLGGISVIAGGLLIGKNKSHKLQDVSPSIIRQWPLKKAYNKRSDPVFFFDYERRQKTQNRLSSVED